MACEERRLLHYIAIIYEKSFMFLFMLVGRLRNRREPQPQRAQAHLRWSWSRYQNVSCETRRERALIQA